MAARDALLLTATVLLVTSCWAKGNDVISLTGATLAKAARKHPFLVVEFHAPWCKDCTVFEPKYKKVAKALAADGSKIVLARINADKKADEALAHRYEVRKLPTIKIFRNGNIESPENFQHSDDVAAMVASLKELAAPVAKRLDSSEVQRILKEDKALAVGVFDDVGDSWEFSVFADVAEGMRSTLQFRYTSDQSELPKDNPPLEGVPGVRVLTAFGEGFADTQVFEKDALQSFVLSKSLPPVIDYFLNADDLPVVARAFGSPHKKCWLLADKNSSMWAQLREAYADVAKTRPEGLLFFVGEDKPNGELLQLFELSPKQCPCLVVTDPEDKGKFFRTKVEPADIPSFFASLLAGKEENRIKSQPLPESNDGPVKVLVAKNFRAEVIDSGMNALIMLYAPWCGYCQELAPIYEEVGEALRHEPGVIVAKMDLTENEVPAKGFESKGFPTLYFHTAEKKIIPFEGQRKVDDLVRFVLLNKFTQEDPQDEDLEFENLDEFAGARVVKDEL